MAIVRDSLFISVVDLKRRLCTNVFQTLFSDSCGTHDFYLETEVHGDTLTIHTLGSQKTTDQNSSHSMLRFDVSISALREFMNGV